MENKKDYLQISLIVLLICLAFCGCRKGEASPQFVVISSEFTKGGVQIHPLLAFDLLNNSCQLTYLGASGQVLDRVVGTNLPSEIVARYKNRYDQRRCSGDATLVLSQDGCLKLSQAELADIVALINAAPPKKSIRESLHPSALILFEKPMGANGSSGNKLE